MGCATSSPQGYTVSVTSMHGGKNAVNEKSGKTQRKVSIFDETFLDETAETKAAHEDYEFQHVLGKGSFAEVRSVRHRKLQRDFAVKTLDLKGASANRFGTFHHERSIWAKLSVQEHPNVVQLHESFQDTSRGYLVMELCSSSLLAGFKAEKTLDEHTLVRYFRDMVSGLQRLHQLRIVHRDVKGDNFLISPDGKTVKLCDFGFAESLPTDGTNGGKLTGVHGTAPYMPPEMLQVCGTHGTSADIWSFGVIVYTMFFGCFPYNPKEMTRANMKECIRSNIPAPTFQTAASLNYNQQVSNRAVAFVNALLVREADERPTADAVMQLDYLKRAGEFAADAEGANFPRPSLFPMLEGAVNSGAFSQAPGAKSEKKTTPRTRSSVRRQNSLRSNAVHRQYGLYDNSESSSHCSTKSTRSPSTEYNKPNWSNTDSLSTKSSGC